MHRPIWPKQSQYFHHSVDNWWNIFPVQWWKTGNERRKNWEISFQHIHTDTYGGHTYTEQSMQFNRQHREQLACIHKFQKKKEHTNNNKWCVVWFGNGKQGRKWIQGENEKQVMAEMVFLCAIQGDPHHNRTCAHEDILARTHTCTPQHTDNRPRPPWSKHARNLAFVVIVIRCVCAPFPVSNTLCIVFSHNFPLPQLSR